MAGCFEQSMKEASPETMSKILRSCRIVMERKIVSRLMLSILLLLSALLYFQWLAVREKVPVLENSFLDLENVSEITAGKEVVVEIGPKPIQTMKLLLFQVKLNGYRNPEKVVIDLSMPGMVMGINRFTLKKIDSDNYEGKTIIPSCTTGKTLWLAKIIINHNIEKEIRFNVQK